MANYAQGVYTPKNPEKYIGKKKPKYRSGWELTFMMFCDNHHSVISWASEAISVPYRNPLTGKQTVYIPDFFVMYQDKFGNKKAEIVEIKPKKQSLIESRVTSVRDKAAVVLNHAKWAAAMAYCKSAGLTFRVITEDDLFYKSKR
jgi:TnsA endonuclease N terminal